MDTPHLHNEITLLLDGLSEHGQLTIESAQDVAAVLTLMGSTDFSGDTRVEQALVAFLSRAEVKPGMDAAAIGSRVDTYLTENPLPPGLIQSLAELFRCNLVRKANRTREEGIHAFSKFAGERVAAAAAEACNGATTPSGPLAHHMLAQVLRDKGES